MDLDSQSWIEDYERLKNDFQRERKATGGIRSEEVKDMIERIITLEKELNTMKESPMQYDLYVANFDLFGLHVSVKSNILGGQVKSHEECS